MAANAYVAAGGTDLSALSQRLNETHPLLPLAVNFSNASPRTLVRSLRVHSTTARGVAIVSPNARVLANTLDETLWSGLQARLSADAFIEMPGAVNATFRNNDLTVNTSLNSQSLYRGSISVGAEGFAATGPR